MIESVGSHRLLECVAAEAQKQGIRQDILVEINIGAEEMCIRDRYFTVAFSGSALAPAGALPT